MFYTILAIYLFIGIITTVITVAGTYRLSTWAEFKRELRSRSFWLAAIVCVLLWSWIVLCILWVAAQRLIHRKEDLA